MSNPAGGIIELYIVRKHTRTSWRASLLRMHSLHMNKKHFMQNPATVIMCLFTELLEDFVFPKMHCRVFRANKWIFDSFSFTASAMKHRNTFPLSVSSEEFGLVGEVFSVSKISSLESE